MLQPARRTTGDNKSCCRKLLSEAKGGHDTCTLGRAALLLIDDPLKASLHPLKTNTITQLHFRLQSHTVRVQYTMFGGGVAAVPRSTHRAQLQHDTPSHSCTCLQCRAVHTERILQHDVLCGGAATVRALWAFSPT